MRGYYTVWFPGPNGTIGDIGFSWAVTVSAHSEEEAVESGLKDAEELNREFGMPPHGIRVCKELLRRVAWPYFHGYAAD